MTTQEAVNTFVDNLDEIIVAVSSNMRDKIQELEAVHTEVLSFLDTDKQIELANEVHKLSVLQQTEEMTHSLKTLARKKQSLTSPLNPNRITDTDIARAKEHPIQDLYSGKLRKQGGKLWGRCAFHNEDTASMVIDTKRNNWHCFGACGVGGDSIAFYAKIHNLDMRKDFTKIVKALI